MLHPEALLGKMFLTDRLTPPVFSLGSYLSAFISARFTGLPRRNDGKNSRCGGKRFPAAGVVEPPRRPADLGEQRVFGDERGSAQKLRPGVHSRGEGCTLIEAPEKRN